MDMFVQAVKEVDGFAHGQFLRYRKEDNYRTFLGGCLTISLVILFIGLFSTMIIDTLTKNIINSSQTKKFDMIPPSFTMNMNTQSKNMLAFGILNLNMNSGKRYFDIILEQMHFTGNPTNITSRTTIPFVPCNKSQWTGINGQIDDSYDNLKLDDLYCAKTNSTLELEGRWSSKTIKVGQLTISKCTENNTLYPNTTCASKQDLQKHMKENGDFMATYYYINANINAADQEFLNFYLDQSNWIHFDLTYASLCQIYLSEYKITTDTSLIPLATETQKAGIYATNTFAYTQRMGVLNNVYFQMNIAKSSFHYDYERSFQKVDETLSFIGGLYGAVLILFVGLSFYSKYSYEIEFGDRIFKKDNEASFGSQYFGFLIFLGYALFNFLTIFGVNLKWQRMREYHMCRMESLKQLDIGLLFKKIDFLEQISKIILEEHHLVGLHLFPKKSISQIKQNRRKYLLQGIMYKQIDKKTRQIYVQQEEYRKRYEDFLSNEQFEKFVRIITLMEGRDGLPQNQEQNKKEITNTAKSLKTLQRSYNQGDTRSKKIWDKIKVNSQIMQILAKVFNNNVNALKHEEKKNISKSPSFTSVELIVEKEDLDNSPKKKQEP